jgi:predicted ATPase
MSKPVYTTPAADAQIRAIDAWWREHRDKAPDLFEQELALTLRTIAAAPSAGKRYRHPRAAVRRFLMRYT